MFVKYLAVVLAAASAVLAAAPVPVLYPHDSNIWVIGFAHNITWSTSGLSSGETGTFTLLKAGVADPTPLASGVDLSSGRTQISVPAVTPGDDYTIVLAAGGSSAESAPFIIATSKSSLPAPGTTGTSGVATTITFGSTTIVSTVTPSAIAASPSGASTSTTSGASSATSGTSSGSGTSSASGSGSGSSTATSPSSSGTSSGSASSSSSSGSSTPLSPAGRVEVDFHILKFLVASVCVGLGAGFYVL